MRLIVRGTRNRLHDELDVPVSKYHAHRALVLASLAEGTSVITGLSTTRQIEWTVSVLRALGAQIDVADDRYVIKGVSGHYRASDVVERGSSGPEGLLNVGSSGTTLYFMTGLAALADKPITLTGMKYFRRRPIKALLDSLQQMGVRLESTDDCPPITVQPLRPRGGDVSIAGTLSQWLSGLLLLAPFAETDTTIHVTGGALNEQPYVDLTVRMMRMFGLRVDVSDDWLTYRVPAGQIARAADYSIPPDIGSAAFGIVAAAVHPGDVLFRGMSATRAAETDHPEAEFLDLAAAMGVPMTTDEETGFVRISHDGLKLQPIDVDCGPIPDLLPALSTLATFAEGTSRLYNVRHIRLKESDRVAAMLQLNRMGGRLEQDPDELRITGVKSLAGATMSSFNDHRVLMALAVAASRASGVSTLTYPRAYRISYPMFLDEMNSIGLNLNIGQPVAEEETEVPASTAEQVQASLGALAEPLMLTEAVAAKVLEAPDEAAVMEVDGHASSSLTWRELGDEADKVAALLLDLGVRRGEPVAVQLPNWSEFVAIALGIMQVGGVVTPIMPVFGPRETAMTLARSRARVMFLPNYFRGRQPVVELLSAIDEADAQGRRLAVEHVVVIRSDHRHGADASVQIPPIPNDAVANARTTEWTWRYYDTALAAVTVDKDAIAAAAPGLDDYCQLLFTSGTTGEPKGVQHTYRSLGLATAMEVRHLGLGPDDRIYVPSPLAHQTGFLYGMLLAWRLGVAVVIQPVWDADVSLKRAFGQAGATFVQAATPFLSDLVSRVEAGAAVPESLRIFVATGAAVPRALAERATAVLGTSVLGAFGTTETCLGTLASPEDKPEDAWGSDGRALPGVDIRIVDDEGAELPAGAEGNYELRSPTVFGGYLQRPDLTADVFTDDGWYRTGDLAYLDEAEFLHITGRVKDVINRGGEKIPVVEIENLLYQHPKVTDVAIVAMPDKRLGERACAFVVPAAVDSALTLKEVQDYLGRHGTSKYYWPERVELVDALPRNVVGKIQKNILRERAAALVESGSAGNDPVDKKEKA
ncbi:3-phosphoshikimate 1-carboxyvinyltransferase [Rathayibacter sp. KR2-224]|uniref:3-phosphoshikimate 1-carboxyvinyltransferase n=1 Tax=Rathayibacter sp. KR2-224 TaxID=3400913 RepID=UPI003C11080C